MTYGEVADQLRESMTWLLQRYRTTHLIGKDQEERRAGSEAMLRYRTAVTMWCLQAVTAATPGVALEDKTGASRTPAEELRFRLQQAVAAGPHEPALTDLLKLRHTSSYVTVWQTAARAAAIGEREIAHAVSWARRPTEQSTVVLKDACDIVRALGVLESRYTNMPGWQMLRQSRRLVRAAETVSADAAGGPQDHTVDQLGWRPAPGLIEGPALPGVGGVVQAQHNVAVELSNFPSAINLRRVLLSQTQVSREAARISEAVDPSLARTFRDRAALYSQLTRAGRDLGGLIGSGDRAARESTYAGERASRVREVDVDATASLQHLAHLCRHVDVRVGGSIERGLAERLYFVSIGLPRLSDQPRGGIHRPHKKWIPVDSPVQAPILELVRSRLQPTPGVPATRESRDNRVAYEALIQQQTARIGLGRSR